VIIFGSIRFLSKKNNQTEIKKKKPKSVQTDRFWFGCLGKKPVQTCLARFWLGFFSWTRFFWFGFGSVFSVLGL
jgi:hypothetical protein